MSSAPNRSDQIGDSVGMAESITLLMPVGPRTHWPVSAAIHATVRNGTA